MRIFFSFFIFSFALSGNAQVSGEVVSKNFHFKDGIYLHFSSFQTDSPDISWEDVEAVIITNPQTSLTVIDSLRWRKSGRAISIDSIWGFSRNGVPSIRIPEQEISKSLPTFAALKLRGKICYFTYPDYRMREVFVAAYNPLTGRPFRTGKVLREKEILVERMLSFETGQLADFNLENFKTWIADDSTLLKSFLELTPAEQQEKLFKTLLIYDDRNLVRTKERL
ncbi:MAG: hypothetical protein CMN32_08855 [Saprospirales bacterium]|jgi:hypothetical protein|nr:hypothetical protein [Saprospirales bacterium]